MERIIVEPISDSSAVGIHPVFAYNYLRHVYEPRSRDKVQSQAENPDIGSWESEGGYIGLGAKIDGRLK